MDLRFDRFRFDPYKLVLEDASGPVPLSTKALKVLRALIAARGEVVTSQRILDEVWPDTHVAEGVIKVRIAEVRGALGDSASRPHFIQTEHRSGYRFIAEVDAHKGGATLSEVAQPYSTVVLVGRGRELAQLQERFARALNGDRRVVLISGEPGIGKTRLVEQFVTEAMKGRPVVVATGQCQEKFGSSEAYMPVLEAVSPLVRQNASTRALLRHYAPTLLVQLPWLIEPAEREELAGEPRGTVSDRMLREIAAFLDAMVSEQPLILVLWATPSARQASA